MIKLVPLQWKYWNEYRHWINEKETARLLDRHGHVTTREHKIYYQKLLKDKARVFFAIVETDSKQFIGICALKNIDKRNHKAELYICLNKKVRGQGYGVRSVHALLDYALDRLKLNRIYLYTPAFNQAALKCYRQAGFVKEGELLEDIYCDGKYYNSIRMGYLKRFRKLSKGKK